MTVVAPKIALLSSIDATQIKGKRALVRVDFNVPMTGSLVAEDSRIKAAIPTINYLKNAGAKIILLSHFGRPKGEISDKFSLSQVLKHVAFLLKSPVQFASDCIGKETIDKVNGLQNGEILLVENTRFHTGDTKNDPEFARELAKLGDFFVQDAFGAVHRTHASTVGVASLLPSYAGFSLEKEITILNQVTVHPKRPVVAIIGGAKISTKFGVLKNLLGKVDTLIIGGGMCYTLLKAQGKEIGKSLCEDSLLQEAKEFLTNADQSNTRIILPIDHVCVTEFNENALKTIVDSDHIHPTQMGVDIGPETIALIQATLAQSKTIIWNGPLGVFEIDSFATGTLEIAKTLAESQAFTIVGGGDSGAAIAKAKVEDQIDHLSTGGGATLEYLEGLILPGIKILEGTQ